MPRNDQHQPEPAGRITIARLAAILGLGVAAVAILGGISTVARDWLRDDGPLPANLSLDDVTLLDDAQQPMIDLKLRNSGEEPALIVAVEIEIASHVPISATGALESSATYDIELPVEPVDLPDWFGAEIAHSVDPNGPTSVDVFTVRLGVPPGGLGDIHDYIVTAVRVRYNDGRWAQHNEDLSISIYSR